jgi:serine/threonine protein kinase
MITCQHCGTSNRNGSTFCENCGLAFTAPKGRGGKAAAPAAARARRAASPGTPAGASAAVAASPPPPPATPAPASAPIAAPASGGINATGRLAPHTKLHRHYLILQTVGQGGMAAVYRGLDTRANKPVAIKEMSQDGLSPEELREALDAFRSEAEVLKPLSHENLPRVYESFSEGSRHYLIMDFVEGQTLEQIQRAAGGGPLPEQDVLRWASQLCNVLAYLHEQKPPIIFRDLKPANVMITPEGRVKLIDFGIARVFRPGRSHDTQILGTPGYAPPEQYGKTQTDQRADVYALGVMLHQLLTGYDPANTPFSLPPAHTRNAAVSPHVQAAIERATRLDRDTRHPTMRAFAGELLQPDGFVFRTGQRARTLPDLIALCRANPQEAAEHLYAHRFEPWLDTIGQRQAARTAAGITSGGGDHATGLAAFIARAGSPAAPVSMPHPAVPSGSSQWSAAAPRTTNGPAPSFPAPSFPPPASVPASVPANPSRTAGNMAGRLAAYGMQFMMARAASVAAGAVGQHIAVEVRPNTVNFGSLMTGQRGTAYIAIAGQHGLPVTGTIASLAPWLRVDRLSFAGPSTIVHLTAETALLPRAGVHHTNLQVTCGAQRLYIPITVDLQSAQPPLSPPRPRAAAGAAQTKHGSGRAVPRWVRIVLSWLAALGTATWAFDLLLRALGAHQIVLPGFLPLAVFLPLVALLVAAPAAVVGQWGPEFSGRWLTATFGAGMGLGATALLARQVPLEQAARFGVARVGHISLVYLLVELLLVSACAAFGATPEVSRGLLNGAAFAVRHGRILIALAALGLGGWLGYTFTHPIFYGLLAPVGVIIGMVVALFLASRASRLILHAAHHP